MQKNKKLSGVEEKSVVTGILDIIEEYDVEIFMRDGVILRGSIFRPDTPGKFPGLLIRTPYGQIGGDIDRLEKRPPHPVNIRDVVRAGYVIMIQDTRGRYTSDGEYIVNFIENTGDAEDGYDTVEWLAEQSYCNGKIGTLGISYNAWMQWQLAKLRPPHLKAMCAFSMPIKMADIDWTNGIFRMARRIYWLMNSIAPDMRKRRGMSKPHTPVEAEKIWNNFDFERWYSFMPWIDFPQYLPEGLAEHVREWFKNPNSRAWKPAEDIYKEIEVPNLDFSGWYDHCMETMKNLNGMQKNARTETARTQTKLIIGPWNHVGLGERKIGDVDFGPLAELNTHDMIIRWFDHWLKDLNNGVEQEPTVRYFVMGAGKWKIADTWPPIGAEKFTYYLDSKGAANEVKNSGLLLRKIPKESNCDTYTYDPKDPTPTIWTKEYFTVPSDRNLLDYRQDILRYRTASLEESIEVVGYPEVVLYASSSAPDTDFFVRLVDEHQDGTALEICYGVVRARYRNSLDREELLAPGQITQFKIKLGPTACHFLKGHRIRLEIASSDFPNFDRNHNTGKNDLFDTELVTAHQKIYHSADYPSQLILEVHNIKN